MKYTVYMMGKAGAPGPDGKEKLEWETWSH